LGSTNKQILAKTVHKFLLAYSSFEFAALNFRNPEKNQYAYKLEGYRDQWIQLGTKREATFTNLDPGEYVLRVKGANNDGVWNEAGTSLKITITPPPWKTWWAYTLYVLLFAAVLYGLRRYELSRMHLKDQVKLEHLEAQKLHELDQMKSRFFANISHEFRTPLTLILGPLEQMLAEEPQPGWKQFIPIMQRNANRLLQLINQLLDLSKLESGSMKLAASHGDFIAFLKGLVMSFESLAIRKRIALRFEVQPSECSALPRYFDRDKIEKIFSNLLANAFKFRPEGGTIQVAVAVGRSSGTSSESHPAIATVPANFVEITIKDTGTGIPQDHLPHIFDRFYQVDSSSRREHEGTGIGLAPGQGIGGIASRRCSRPQRRRPRHGSRGAAAAGEGAFEAGGNSVISHQSE